MRTVHEGREGVAVEGDAAAAHLGDQLQRLAQLLVAAALADYRGVPARRMYSVSRGSSLDRKQVNMWMGVRVST